VLRARGDILFADIFHLFRATTPPRSGPSFFVV
jgi:hypothetical protein